jgi:hypothetical protein
MGALSTVWPRAFMHLRPGSTGAADGLVVDVTHVQRRYRSADAMAAALVAAHRPEWKLYRAGLASSAEVARFASRRARVGAVRVVPPWQTLSTLAAEPLWVVFELEPGLAASLSRVGVRICADLAGLPTHALRAIAGPPGERLQRLCRGEDVEGLASASRSGASLRIARTLPAATGSRRALLAYLRDLCRSAATQGQGRRARRVRVDMVVNDRGARRTVSLSAVPAGAGAAALYAAVRPAAALRHDGLDVTGLRLTLDGLRNDGGQMDLFGTRSSAA